MNWNQFTGNLTQLRGKVKERWGKFTANELTTLSGQRDQIAGSIQKKYGIEKEGAQQEADRLIENPIE